MLTCTECGVRSASPIDFGWKGYRSDNPELDEPPALAFYCPTCAAVELGDPPRRWHGRYTD